MVEFCRNGIENETTFLESHEANYTNHLKEIVEAVRTNFDHHLNLNGRSATGNAQADQPEKTGVL